MTPSALIDTEYYLYRSACSAEQEANWHDDVWTYVCRHDDAKDAFDSEIASFMASLPGLSPLLCFGARTSFRKGLWPAYKENRRKMRRPAGYQQLMEWAQKAGPARGWGVATLEEVEGDDVMGVLCGPDDVIVSADKDMLTIPGQHFRDGDLVRVDRREADYNFFRQVLTGDASDNYPGCPRYGPVTAAKLLADCADERSMWLATRSAFLKAGLDERFAITMARCARILRLGEYDHGNRLPILWSPPEQR